ncbi:MAG TPA: MFS transporter [Bacteroidales bacterium]|nr:MFS transporter [Bacteroidales bacterium]
MKQKAEKLWTINFINACIANFLMGFSFYLLIPTLPFFIIEQFQADAAVVGAILSSYIIAALAVRPLSGYLVDSFSRKGVYIVSFAFFISLYFGYLFVASIFFLVVLRVLHGFTWSTITTSGSTLAIDIIPAHRRGEGVGYFGLSTNLSMALGPLAGLFLHDHYPFDYIFYASIISCTIGLIAATFIKAPVREVVHHHKAFSLDRFILVKSIPVGINCMLIAIPYGMLLSFAALYGKEIHVGSTGMFFTYMAIGIGSSRIFSGKLIDGGRIHFVSLLGAIVLTGSFALFAFSNSALLYFVSAFVIGVGYGILFPAYLYLFINMAHHNQRGTANSTYFTAFDLGVGLGMILAGKIADVASLSAAFGVGTLLCALAILFYWLVSERSYEKGKVV